MAKSIKRKIFSLLVIWIIVYVCYLYYKSPPPDTLLDPTAVIKEKHKIQNRTRDTKKNIAYIFKGKKIGLFKTEIDRYHSATACKSSPVVLLVINSYAGHKIRRNGIRKTWGLTISQKEMEDLPTTLWRTIFIVGTVNDNAVMAQVYEEAKLFNDIVISNIPENRRHLTDKTILGMVWAQLYCQPAFFFKGDDDVWVNQFSLYKYVLQANQSINVDTNRFWKGFVAGDNRKPIRNKHSKYYLSMQDFDGDRFPPFCSGFAYILSGHVLKVLTKTIKDVKIVPIVDDVYVGLLGNKSGIAPKLETRFRLTSIHKDLKQEVQSALAKHHVLTASDQMKFRNMSYRHHLNQFCVNIHKHLNSVFFEDFQFFFQYNFNRECNCSDLNSID